MKILICGLPGSGKTWLAERLIKVIENCAWYNADIVRKSANDWDFSMEGRIRQAKRMKTFADFEKQNGRWVICDFVAPTEKAREAFDINKEDGSVSIYNNGDSIKVEKHSSGLYNPHLIFGRLLTSGNYKKGEKRTVGGKNGYGAKIVNIFSDEFNIELVDRHTKKKYIQK